MAALIFLVPLFAFIFAIASGYFIAKKVYDSLKEKGETSALISAIFIFIVTAGIVLAVIYYIIASNVEFGR